MFPVILSIISIITLSVTCATAAPTSDVKIESYNYKSLNEQNEYKFNYQLSDGQARSEEGVLKTDANGDSQFIVTGSFQYIGPDNVQYTVYYTADEHGFQPFGSHIPGLSSMSTPALGIPGHAVASLVG